MDRGRTRIAVAMSGGVDSSVAAALLKDQGWDVIGVTARMTPGFSRCCSEEDVERARQVARQIGIPHRVADLSAQFQKAVVAYFTGEYLAGRTPAPCAVCNRAIKFGALAEAAAGWGADLLATGHFARIESDPQGRTRLLRGADARKDQSYFLCLLRQEQLARVRFPVGDMTKAEVQGIARRRNLASRDGRESQDLCFVGETDHGTWIDVRCLDAKRPGDIVDMEGRVVGRHRGIHHYTIGQREGLGIAVGRPMYVAALDAERNTVTVAERAALLKRRMRVTGVNWALGEAPAAAGEGIRVETRIRHNHKMAASVARAAGEGCVEVEFEERQFAVTPGQVAAFYRGEEVLGGGWIEGSIAHGAEGR